MLNTTIEEAFEINPTITIKRDAEVPFVSMDRLTPGQRDVDAGEIRQFRSGSKFAAGDTLMARITPCLENKKIARYLPNDNFNKIAAGSTEFIVLRGKPGITTTEFSYYFAITPTIHETAIALMTGTSGRQRVDMAAFRAQEVEIPKLAEQRKITDLLGALDDKITANVRVLKTANELVKNLYTAIPKSSNHAIESIGELVKKNVKPEEMDDSKALINLEHFDSKQIWISRHAQVPEATSAKSSFQVGDVLFGKLRPYFRKVGVAPIGGYCSTDVLVVRPREDSYRGLLLAAMSAEETVAIATQNSNGTRMPRAKWADIASCAIPDPDDPKSIELGKLMDVLIPKCNALIHENHVLARTRDELLPLLMSGRITVGEAEEAADEAASES
ncbi:TPA: restriction endonuclease subunit S [Corynebacterium striatum]|nr:restriction endonuclease subunit S [Corynebacterium striatum]